MEGEALKREKRNTEKRKTGTTEYSEQRSRNRHRNPIEPQRRDGRGEDKPGRISAFIASLRFKCSLEFAQAAEILTDSSTDKHGSGRKG